MDTDGDGQVSKLEYVSFMLVKLGKVEQDEIETILSQFAKVDADNSGFLDREDIELLDHHMSRARGEHLEE